MKKLNSNDWQQKKLKDVADYINGRGFKKTEWSKSGKPIIRIQNLTGTSSSFNYFDGVADSKHQISEGDLLVSWSATIGSYIYKGDDAVLNQHIFKVEPKINKLFLHYYLTYIGQLLYSKTHGTGMTHITKGVFDDIDISVPSSEQEQQKIVDKIEELFSVIDASNQAIVSAENKLSTYEYSFLKKCIYGEYLAESSCQIESSSNSVKLRSLPKNWQWKKLPELGELARGKSKHRPRNDKSLFGGKYPFIQTGEVRNSYKFIKSFSTTYNDKGLSQSKLWEKGTLCITIAANIADTAILNFDACFPDSVVGFIADTSICDVEYIEFFIRTEKERLTAYAPATAQKNINLRTLSNISVPLPPLAEQRKIVEMAEEHSSIANKLNKDFLNMRRKRKLLKQSILKQAFEGKLV